MSLIFRIFDLLISRCCTCGVITRFYVGVVLALEGAYHQEPLLGVEVLIVAADHQTMILGALHHVVVMR